MLCAAHDMTSRHTANLQKSSVESTDDLTHQKWNVLIDSGITCRLPSVGYSSRRLTMSGCKGRRKRLTR